MEILVKPTNNIPELILEKKKFHYSAHIKFSKTIQSDQGKNSSYYCLAKITST